MEDDTKEVDWNEGGHVHNWRNHIGKAVKSIWHTFSEEQRKAIIEDAEDSASYENWD